MREREAMNFPAFGVAMAGPLAGIGIWYTVDRWTGHPGFALGLAAGVIYVSARLTGALASATSLHEEMGAISIMLVVVGVPYAALLLIGVPAVVALPIGIILGPRFAPAVERRISLVGASVRPNRSTRVPAGPIDVPGDGSPSSSAEPAPTRTKGRTRVRHFAAD